MSKYSPIPIKTPSLRHLGPPIIGENVILGIITALRANQLKKYL
jgi:hypothetical protein